MPKRNVGITRNETREEQILRVRNELIMLLHRGGYSYGEIERIINIDKAGANRIVRFGKNTSKPVRAS